VALAAFLSRVRIGSNQSEGLAQQTKHTNQARPIMAGLFYCVADLNNVLHFVLKTAPQELPKNDRNRI
jgi:hypothetical protein